MTFVISFRDLPSNCMGKGRSCQIPIKKQAGKRERFPARVSYIEWRSICFSIDRPLGVLPQTLMASDQVKQSFYHPSTSGFKLEKQESPAHRTFVLNPMA